MSSPRLLSALGLAAVLAACRGLAPLPPPRPDHPQAATTAAALWASLAASNPVPAAEESAYRSTSRMILGGLGGKVRQQRAAQACRNQPPPGFSLLAGVPIEGAPPLFAYRYAGLPDLPVVVVLHGLYDSKNTRYVTRTATWLAAQGFGVVVPDLRWHGCLLDEKWLPSLGFFEGPDLLAWGRWLAAQEPDRPLALVGFSLGGLDVIHALAQPGADAVFRGGGVAISPPAALSRTLASLDRPSHLADRGLLTLIDRGFKRFMATRLRDQRIAVPPQLAGRPFAVILDHVLRARFGPLGVNPEMLYAMTDPAPRLAATRRPLLVLTSENDPLFGPTVAVELERSAAGNPWVHTITTPYGGHIGQPGLYPAWFATLLDRFLRQSAAITGP